MVILKQIIIDILIEKPAQFSAFIYQLLVCKGCLMPALLVVAGIKKWTCIIECSTSFKSQHGQVVCTTSLVLTLQLHIAKITIILYYCVLDSNTFFVDELENLIGSSSGLSVCLIGIQISHWCNSCL